MFKLFILILLLAFYHSSYADDYQTGGINISQFSWVIDGNNIKITSAMATAISYQIRRFVDMTDLTESLLIWMYVGWQFFFRRVHRIYSPAVVELDSLPSQAPVQLTA